MTDNELVKKINALMSSGFELEDEKLVPSARLKEDLQLDSLDAVDMLVYLEDTFKMKVEGERLTQIRTMNDVYDLVRDGLNGRNTNTNLSGNF